MAFAGSGGGGTDACDAARWLAGLGRAAEQGCYLVSVVGS